MGAISRALGTLLESSWPDSRVARPLVAVGEATDLQDLRDKLAPVFERIQGVYPGAHFWVKDEKSNFLGACSNLIEASGIDTGTFFSGINDLDPRLPWMRQGPLYIRDDREVYETGQPKLDIVERQDRADGTLWLKTSKVPYHSEDRASGGTVGGFNVISTKEAWALSRKHDRETQELPAV